MFFAVVLMAFSLNIDALSVGISYGVRGIRISFFSKIIISVFSVVYSMLALLFGNWLIHILPDFVARFIGAGILVIIGTAIIFSAFFKSTPKQKKEGVLFHFIIKPLGVTVNVIKNPPSCDFDCSKKIEPYESLFLGLALSLDAIGVSLGSALGGLNFYFIPFFIGLFQLVFLSVGSLIGRKLNENTKINDKACAVISGCLLFVIAALRFI